MNHYWTSHIEDQEEKARFETEVRYSHILRRQNEIIDQMIRELEASERSLKAYDSPNWDYRQAHLNGSLQSLMKIKTLNTFDQKELNDR